MNDKPGKNGSFISWWLFEADYTKNEKLLVIDDGDGNPTELDVSTPELLYKWLVEKKVN
jgi:hypothetical protein